MTAAIFGAASGGRNAANFARKAYAGNGATGQTIVNNLDGDLIWINNEDADSFPRSLFDSTRGVSLLLRANATTVEASVSGVSAFNTNGFVLGSSSTTNDSGNQFVSFAWKESAGYFDAVTFTGTTPTPQAVSHNLGSAPDLMLLKSRDSSTDWWVYHTSLGAAKYDILNQGGTPATSSAAWNNTSPTSSHFTVGSSASNTGSMVAYLFKALAGSSAFGTYTGTGTTTQQDVNVGFAPTIVWIKSVTGGDWLLLQSSGKAWHINSTNKAFNGSTTRSSTSATGFSVGTAGTTANGDYNNSGEQYIYCAWRGV